MKKLQLIGLVILYTLLSNTAFAALLKEIKGKFIDAITKQFQPANKSQYARDQLAKISQTKSVLEYTALFNKLCIRIDNLHHSEQYDRYIRGLKPHIRIEVQKVQPVDFISAVQIAQTIDNIYFQNRKVNFKSSTTYNDRDNYGGAVAMEVNNVDQQEVNAVSSRPRLNLSKEEFERRKNNKLCFGCGKPGHRMSECRTSKKSHQVHKVSTTASTSPKN